MNVLSHSGTSQYERLLQSLVPENFSLDDRSIKELLHSTFQYAGLLRYYNDNNQAFSDWTNFWKVETLTFLAHISTIDVESLYTGYYDIKKEFEEIVKTQDEADSAGNSNDYCLQLIEYLKEQALKIQEIIDYLPGDITLRQEIIAMVAKDSIIDAEQLAGTLKILIGFHKEAHKKVLNERLDDTEYSTFFNGYWGIPDTDYFDNQIDHSDEYLYNDQKELDKIAKAFYHAYKNIKRRATFWFDKHLENDRLRQPHVALFIAFLRLFKHAQNSLNNLTKQQLMHYFERVLCMHKMPFKPDDTYLILELAATVDRHLIDKDIHFLGGQDKNGKHLIYNTLEKWFLNITKVKSIKTIYFDTNGIFRNFNNEKTYPILHAPDVKTSYKMGSEQPNKQYDYWRFAGDNPDLPHADVGFAIASPQLILREGRRIVTIIMDTSGKLNESYLDEDFSIEELNSSKHFTVKLSSEQEWQELNFTSDISEASNLDILEFIEPSYNIHFVYTIWGDEIQCTIKLIMVLERDHLPVEKPGDNLLKIFGLQSEWPIVYLTIFPNKGKEIKSAKLYGFLRNLELNDITINVKVDDIQKNLILQNDQGVFDGTQKFFPFGTIPEIGGHFYIGSTEVFQKSLENLTIEFDWIDPLQNFQDHYQEYSYELKVDRNNIPEPKIKVDFIDRAKDRVPQRIIKTGKIALYYVKVKVLSTDGNLANVLVKDNNNIEHRTNNLGETNFIIYNNPDITFSVNEDKLLDYDAYPYQASNAIITPEESRIGVEGYNQISVILYPKRILKLEGSFNGFVTCIIQNIINENRPLENIKVNNTNANEYGEYKVNLNDSSELIISYNNLNGSIAIPVEDFSFVGVRIPPLFVNNSTIIRDTDENPITGVKVKAYSDATLVHESVTNEDGEYEINNSFNKLVFNYGSFKELTLQTSSIVGFDSFSTQIFRTITVRNQITDYSSILAVNKLKASINIFDAKMNLIKAEMISNESIDESGDIIIKNVNSFLNTENIKIQTEYEIENIILKSEFLNADKDKNISTRVNLINLNEEWKGNSKNNEEEEVKIAISIKYKDDKINDLSIYLKTDEAEIQLPIDENSIIIPKGTVRDGETKELYIKHENFPHIRISIENNIKEELVIEFLDPLIDKINSDKIEITGTVVSKFGHKLSGVIVRILNNYEGVITDVNGFYTISPTHNFPFSLEYIIDGYESLIVDEIEGSSNINLKLFPIQIFNRVSGNIKNIYKEALNSVTVRTGDYKYNQIQSDELGDYTIEVPRGMDKLTFARGGGFETLTVEIGKKTNLDITLYYSDSGLKDLISEDTLIKDIDIDVSAQSLNRDPREQEFNKYSPTLRRGFIRLTLAEADFLHKIYPKSLINSTISLANNVSTDDRDIPNQPYTPSTNTIRLSYSSTQAITGVENKNIDEYFHVFPFNGYANIGLKPGLKLLPQYQVPDLEVNTGFANGNLYIGLENLSPGSNLSLFFHIQEGSETEPDADAPEIYWAYLAKNNKWKLISKSNLINDTTHGLKKTGIIVLTTPRDMVNETTLFEGNQYWLRVAVCDNKDKGQSSLGLPSIVDIKAQAVIVQFRDNNNEHSHLQKGLEAGKIKQLKIGQSAIKSIEQPIVSEKGRPAEEGNPFYIRVSERLRHRDRAVTIYDYEHLILQHFPDVQRVKCLRHTKPNFVNIFNPSDPVKDESLMPGYVTIAVIPKIKNTVGKTMVEPRFSKGVLTDMEIYLRKQCSLFVAHTNSKSYLRVVNPIYDEIRVEVSVQLKTGEDEIARKFNLDSEIKNFIAPWLSNPTQPIEFGKSIHRSDLILLIEKLEYIVGIGLLKIKCNDEPVEGNEILATTDRSVLTSIFNESDNPSETDHIINIVDVCSEKTETPIFENEYSNKQL